jgi:thioredoxin 1
MAMQAAAWRISPSKGATKVICQHLRIHRLRGQRFVLSCSGIASVLSSIQTKGVIMAEVTVLSTDNFDATVLESDKPYLVDFWAEWCGPCRALGPVIEELADSYPDKLAVGKLNVDDNRAIASRYNVMSIPTVILFKDGQPAATSVGAVPKEELARRIEPYF